MVPMMEPTSQNRITILHYTGYENDRGGIVAVVRALAGAAGGWFGNILGVSRGFRWSSEGGAKLPIVEFTPIKGETISLGTLWRARAIAREVWTWLAQDPGRIFHGHSRAGMLVAFWLARWGERRVAVTVHSYGRQRWFYRYVARQLGDRLRWLSPAMKGHYYGQVTQSGWDQCLPSCSRFSATAGVSRQNRSAPSRRAGGVGALVPVKKWELVLEALAQLPEEERWSFIHIGTDDGSPESQAYGRQLREKTRSLGLERWVRWLGQQSSPEALFGEIDLLLVPSHNESFSLARLEALTAGVLTLSADSGGARDFVEPPVNGWLFRDGDTADLARQLKALASPSVFAEGRIDFEQLQRFSPEASVERHAALYKSLLAGGK